MNQQNFSSAGLSTREAQHEPLGRIVSVTGSQAIVLLDRVDSAGTLDDYDRPELGAMLAITCSRTIVLGMVSALSVPIPSHDDASEEIRIVELELLGELVTGPGQRDVKFRRGVAIFPCLGDRVRKASRFELKIAYACDDERTAVRIGSLQQDQSIPSMVMVDELLSKHFAILGTTGTGKSCAVALLLRAVLKRNPQAHIVLLDPHNEYSSCFGQMAELVTPDDLTLPFWLMTYEETIEVLVGKHIDNARDIEVLGELIPIAKAIYANKNSGSVRTRLQRRTSDSNVFSVDTPVPYRISDLITLLEQNIGRLDQRGALAPYKRLKSRLETITRDPRYSFMFGKLTVQDDMAAVLGRLFRIPVNGKPITIIELSGFPSEITNVVVSVLCRMTFDFALWSEGAVPITLVCEEAHRYVPEDSSLGFEPTKRAMARIAKEGRKYGVSLGLISQRPAELDATILSQCNTVFAMRLSNEKDQEIVKAAISDAAASLMEFIPAMGDREAIAFGEGMTLPGRMKFDALPEHALPKSGTASFTQQWNQEISNEDFVASVVARWRAASVPESVEVVADEITQEFDPETQAEDADYDEPSAVAVSSSPSEGIERRLSIDTGVPDQAPPRAELRKMSPADAVRAQAEPETHSIRREPIPEDMTD